MLFEAAGRKGMFPRKEIPTIDWDGENDLDTLRSWMLEDLGTSHSLDDLARRVQREILPPKFLSGMLFGICNRYTNRLRKG